MPKLSIVKVGGNVIENKALLAEFLADFQALKGPKILVHGGGKKATKLAEKLQLEVQMIEGRRITDSATLELITGVYAGEINKNIVAKLQAQNCNALGLSGADGNAILSKKRAAKPIDFGWVGDVVKVNDSLFTGLLSLGITPVCCALTHDKNGQLLNTNADTIASQIALALAQQFDVTLYYCFELPGVLKDVQDPSSLIEHLSPKLYQQLKENKSIHSGMIPKLDNAFAAIDKGVKEVAIGAPKMIQENTKYTSISKG